MQYGNDTLVFRRVLWKRFVSLMVHIVLLGHGAVRIRRMASERDQPCLNGLSVIEHLCNAKVEIEECQKRLV